MASLVRAAGLARGLRRTAGRSQVPGAPTTTTLEATAPPAAAARHVAVDDCERCRPGLVAQPVNTVSSLTFVASGWLSIRAAQRGGATDVAQASVGWAAVAAGLGSVAYHGPGTAFGHYLHDASLLGLLGTIALADTATIRGRVPSAATMAAVVPVALAAARPRTSAAAQLALGAAAVAAEGARFTARPPSGAARFGRTLEAVVSGAGAVAHLLGRTGGPLCRPDSRLQPHALWHGAMATAVWLRARDV